MYTCKVSIVITIYNREKYLHDCVCSLFEQTLDDIEFIFVDDASTDNSMSVLEQTIEQYPYRKAQVVIIRLEKNCGRAVARQTGINHVKGEYVIHVDSDDWVDNNMLELLYLKAKESNADIVGCNVTHEYSDYRTVFKQKYSNMDGNIRGLLNGDIFPSLCTSLTRTSLIKDNHITFPQGLDTGEDLLFNLHLYLKAHKVIGIDVPSYHYRHTEDSGSYQHTEKSIESVIEVARRIENIMKETGNYDKYEEEIQFRKFSMKSALITSFDNKVNNTMWLNLFPETHKNIWHYSQFSWNRRLEFWLAANNMFFFASLFQKLLDIQHSIRHINHKFAG